MRLAALFSGGKDSTYAAFRAVRDGHDISCLLTAEPTTPDSMLLHHPNIRLTKLQARSMRMPHIYVQCKAGSAEAETDRITEALRYAKDRYGIDGAVHGGISSVFQKSRFDSICRSVGLEAVSPVWRAEPGGYMRGMIRDGFECIITSVSAGGLDESWLGERITEDSIGRLERLSVQYGFNLNFEGGEAETIVLDCPLFEHGIRVVRSTRVWNGYIGRFEITEAVLD